MTKPHEDPSLPRKARNRAYVSNQFEGYLKMVYPHYAVMPPDQKAEIRKAFFAGAATLYGFLLGNLSEGDETTTGDEMRLADVGKELDDFSSGILGQRRT